MTMKVTGSFATIVPGAIVCVTEMFACVAVRVVTVALWLAGLGSLVSELIVVVSLMVEPAGVLGNTWTTNVKLAEAPAGSVAMNATWVLPGVPAPNGGPEVWASETKVVLAGTKFVAPTFWASLGPAFASVIV